MSKSMRRIVAATAVLGVMTVSTACYGPFNLTKNVYHWNSNVKGSGEVNNKWMKEIVFFGMFIIPVYEFSLLLDTFIFNSIHFWTGDSPIKSSDLHNDDKRVVTLGETTLRWTSFKDGGTVTYERDGAVERRAMIVAGATGYRLIDENGSLLSEAEYGTDGSVSLLDGNRRIVDRWSKEQLQSIAQRQ